MKPGRSGVGSIIAILDDEPARIDAMLALLASRYPGREVRTFDNAPEMIDWLQQNLDQVDLLCLDHDLGPTRLRDGAAFDPGIGRDVVDYLATRRPVCPTIVHTTNSLAAPGMQRELQDANWPFVRVVPYGDLEWIEADWIEAVISVLPRPAN